MANGLRKLEVLAGLAYLALSVWSSWTYLALVAPAQSNSVYWPSYNVTGHEYFVIDVLNHYLTTSGHAVAPSTLTLLSPETRRCSSLPPDLSPAAGRQVLYTHLNTLPRALTDLRRTRQPESLYVQYCWVDFDRRWDVAHTAERSLRCRSRYVDNAANYMETTFRNTNWAAFMFTSGDAFEISIGQALAATPGGRAWVLERPTAAMALSVGKEVAYLQSRNLTRYDLQWHNEYNVGFTDTIRMVNALGIESTTTLKDMRTSSFAPWTSVTMYWSFRNDLWAMQSANRSLVRDTPRHFETRVPRFSLFYAADEAKSASHRAFEMYVGPQGSVDVEAVAVPSSVVAMYTAFRAALWTVLVKNRTMHEAFNRLPAVWKTTPVPRAFVEPSANTPVVFVGGNLLCTSNAGTLYPQAQLSFDDSCDKWSPMVVAGSREAILFALWASRHSVQSIDLTGVCRFGPALDLVLCVETLEGAARLLVDLALLLPPSISWGEIPHFVQYTASAQLLLQPILLTNSTADPWNVFGWLCVFDWIESRREVLRFDGDNGTVVVMSEAYAMVAALDNDGASTASTNHLLYGCMVYVSVIHALLACGVGALALWRRLDMHGRSLFLFHLLVNPVWVGRPLVFLRGVTAIVLASSTNIELIHDAFGDTRFAWTRRSIWSAGVVAGEASWVVFVLNDIILVWLNVDAASAAAPLASFLAWLATVVWQIAQPVLVSATLDRTCRVYQTSAHVECSSGTVQVGYVGHVATLLGLQVGSFIVALVLTSWWRRHHGKTTCSKRSGAPAILHGAAVTFLHRPQSIQSVYPCDNNSLGVDSIDSIVLVLVGLIPLPRTIGSNRRSYFDIKLWRVVHVPNTTFPECTVPPSAIAEPACSPYLLPSVPASQAGRRLARLRSLGGLIYVALSAVSSVSYIAVSQVNMANDFYWASFNLSGVHAAIAFVVDAQLALNQSFQAIQLDESKWAILRLLDGTLSAAPWWGARVQFEALGQDLVESVNGLRALDPCKTPWVSTQYCWVDFARQWSMASTAARQRRCEASFGDNGAVYLEAWLRNIRPWSAFSQCWGDAFDKGIASALSTTIAGRTFLAQVLAPNDITVEDEVSYWHRHRITKYTPQWQNYKVPGLVNTYSITSDLGMSYDMFLLRKQRQFRLDSQTSMKMYWAWASDLWAVSTNATAIGGLSLVRESGNFAFANTTPTALLVQNTTLGTPFAESFQLLQKFLGPFGSIDMINIPCPHTIKAYMSRCHAVLKKTILDHANHAKLHAYNAIAPTREVALKPLPSVYQKPNLVTAGGNLLCPGFGDTRIASGLRELTARLTLCNQQVIALLSPRKDVTIFAAIAAGLYRATSADIGAICSHNMATPTCNLIVQHVNFTQANFDPDDVAELAQLAAVAKADARAAQVHVIQFVRILRGPLTLVPYQFFDPSDASFDFWSWLYMTEWALAEREVISFQGDRGQLAILSEAQAPFVRAPHDSEFPVAYALYARSGVQVVTGAMLSIALIAVVYIAHSRGHVEGLNMLELNRVAGVVWIGRPLLFLRGITALWLVSTATLELANVDNMAIQFTVPPLPWYKALLGVSEVMWMVYIINDVFMALTGVKYTTLYAVGTAALVWVVTAVVTLLRPVVHQVTIAPTCQIDEIDFQTTCSAGQVAIGQSARFGWLMLMIGACNVVALGATKVIEATERRGRVGSDRSRAEKATPDLLLLSTGAKHLFDRTHWTHHGAYYVDPASAFLSGLVTARWQDTLYILDIKLWRGFMIPAPADTPAQFHTAIPMMG